MACRITMTLLLAVSSVAHAQDAMQLWLSPEFGRQELSLRYDEESYFNEPIEGQDNDLRFDRHGLRLQIPVMQQDDRELVLSPRLKVLDFETDAWFPDSSSLLKRDMFPNHLYDVRLDTTYRQQLDSDKIIGGTLSIGSPSDRPFSSGDEIAVTVNAFFRLAQGERNAWLFMLNYSNNREFCPDVPIPGIAYQYQPEETFSALIGLPYSSLRWRMIDPLAIELSYFIPRTIHARLTYDIVEQLSLYAGYDWFNERYFRHDREDDDDRLFYYEQRVSAGLEWEITPRISVDVHGGYAFDRFFFEGERYDDRSDNRLSIDDGPFVGARVVVGLGALSG